MNNTIYEFEAVSITGEKISLSKFKGKVLLIVNTASKCGFTPQYAGLEKLYKQYKDDGLVVLGFPCDQFGGQEPGDNSAIETFCTVNYGVTFPMFQKIEVNGSNTHPLFQYLKQALPGFMGERIKWNFTKFLIDADGQPIKRFAPSTAPEKIAKHIKALL